MLYILDDPSIFTLGPLIANAPLRPLCVIEVFVIDIAPVPLRETITPNPLPHPQSSEISAFDAWFGSNSESVF